MERQKGRRNVQTLAERTESIGGNCTSRPDNDTPFTGLHSRSPDFGQVRLLRQKPRRKPSSADGSFPLLILMQQPDTRCLRVPERLLPLWFPSATYHLLLPTFLGSLGEAPGGGSSWQRGKGTPFTSLLKPTVLTGCQKLREVLGMQQCTCFSGRASKHLLAFVATEGSVLVKGTRSNEYTRKPQKATKYLQIIDVMRV